MIDQWDLEYRQLFAEGVGTVDLKPSIETLDLVLLSGSYRMIFANFENDPDSLQRQNYTGHLEFQIY